MRRQLSAKRRSGAILNRLRGPRLSFFSFRFLPLFPWSKMAPKAKNAKTGGKTATTKAAKEAEKRAASPAPSDGSNDSADTLSVSSMSLNGQAPTAGLGHDPEAGNRTSTGVLTSHRDSRDVKIEQYSLSFYSQILLQDTTIELNYGRRYGLIGANGCGAF